jgi:hypothetical protein
MEIGRRRWIQGHSELILDNCWKLADNSNEDGVSDLTMRQRAGERELYKEAARKNLKRSRE